jgi:hypothetical protein
VTIGSRHANADKPSRSPLWSSARREASHQMELDSIDERVITDRPCVSCTPAERLAVRLSGLVNVGCRNATEGQQIDLVNLDLASANGVSTTYLHLRSPPQANRDRDPAICHGLSQLGTELHRRSLGFERAKPPPACCYDVLIISSRAAMTAGHEEAEVSTTDW